METENKNLTEEELSEVSGGAGAAAGKYQEGDLVTVKTDQYYYFGRLTDIEVYYDGDTRYIVDCAYTAGHLQSYTKVRSYGGRLRINPANPSTGVVIKKIYDYPMEGPCHISYLDKWVK